MKLTTKTRYGVRALLDLAVHKDKGPVLLRDISKRQGISEKYLQQVFHALSLGGIVRSIRGAKGGFVLNKEASGIKLSDVVRVLEGPLSLVGCVDNEKHCERASGCVVRTLWEELSAAIVSKLDEVTLEGLVERYGKFSEKAHHEYEI